MKTSEKEKAAVEALEQVMVVCRGFLAEKGMSY
jgi:hypothetical protein